MIDHRFVHSSCARTTRRPLQAPFQVQCLFNNKVKTFTDKKIHLKVDPSVAPHHSCAYTVPHSHKTTFKKELDRLIQEGVMEKCGRVTWVAGTFVVPKKDGRICWVSDF